MSEGEEIPGAPPKPISIPEWDEHSKDTVPHLPEFDPNTSNYLDTVKSDTPVVATSSEAVKNLTKYKPVSAHSPTGRFYRLTEHAAQVNDGHSKPAIFRKDVNNISRQNAASNRPPTLPEEK